MNENEKYYHILSLKWSKGRDILIWWRQDGAGYTTDLADAGIYSQQNIDDDPDHFDKPGFTFPVPIEVVRRHSMRVVSDSKIRKILAEARA